MLNYNAYLVKLQCGRTEELSRQNWQLLTELLQLVLWNKTKREEDQFLKNGNLCNQFLKIKIFCERLQIQYNGLNKLLVDHKTIKSSLNLFLSFLAPGASIWH